jgi:hypothetical protein
MLDEARALVHRIRAASAALEVPCLLVRHGSRHEVWEVGGVRVSIPRHRDINEWTAEAIMRDLESILGNDWWRS